MMKRWLVGILVLVMTISLVSCGDVEEEKGQEYTSESSEELATQKDSLKEKDTVTEGGTTQSQVSQAPETQEVHEVQEEPDPVVPLQVLVADKYLGEWSESDSGEWDESYTKLSSVSWQELILSEEYAKVYPELAERLEEANKTNEEYYKDILTELKSLAQDALAGDGEYFYPYYSNSYLGVQRADSRILSIREDFEDYSGGVHGYYGVVGRNYDVETGKEVLLSDVLTRTESLPEILSEKIIEKYADEYETFESLQEYLEEEYTAEDYNWTMSYQGITFYFNPYEIASYAAGCIQATIWFDEATDLFDAEYMERPEGGYAMAVPLGSNLEVDFDISDNKRDQLYVSSYYPSQEYQDYGMLSLSIAPNDTYYDMPGYGYDFTPYLVCVGEQGAEQYYLYVESVQENDYSILHVFDLNQEEIQETVFEGMGISGFWDEDAGEYGTYYDYVLNDPQSFEMVTRVDILGTWSGRKHYSINIENGLPQTDAEEYEIDTGFVAVSRIPLEVTMLPDMETEELPAGTNFKFVRTDNYGYVDAILDDGRECRIYVKYEGWLQLINGLDQWECFEELPYAG